MINIKSNVLKSISGSVVIKIFSSLIGFVSFPLLLNSLGINNYGIWVTLTSLIAWLNLFDFGSGYSLKNRVTESLASDDNEEIQILLSGTIQFYLILTLIFLIIFPFALYYVKVFKDNVLITCILYLPVILSFPFTLGHFTMQGLKKFNLFNLILFLQSFFWLIVVLLLKYKIIYINLAILALLFSSLYVLSNFILFWVSLRKLKFKWNKILVLKNFKSSKDNLVSGTKFFILQLSSLLLFSIGNILTYDNLDKASVTRYDTINKFFMIGMTLFNVIISIYWTEISHAKALKDFNMLKKIKKQLLYFSLIFTIGSVIVSFIIPIFVTIWTKGVLKINLIDVFPFAALVSIQFFAYTGAVFLNAFEDLKGQIYLSVVSAIFMIPLVKMFYYFNFGISSVPIASAILTTIPLIYCLYKSNIIINTVKND